MYGVNEVYEVKNREDIYLYLENSLRRNRIKYVYEGIEELNYSIKKGAKLGTVKVMYEGEELTSYDVYLEEELEYYHPYIYAVIVVSGVVMLFSLSKLRRKKRKRKKRKVRR